MVPVTIFAMILGFVTMTPLLGHLKNDHLENVNLTDRTLFVDLVFEFVCSSSH